MATRFVSQASLNKFAEDESPFQINQGCDRRPNRKLRSPWACGCSLRNLCRATLSAELDLAEFDYLTKSIYRWVDSLPRQDSLGGKIFAAFHPVGAGPERYIFVVLGWPCFSPKTQVYVYCQPDGADLKDDFFNGAAPSLPWCLEVRCAASRLCAPSKHAFDGLRHVTCDEVVRKMLQVAPGRQWVVNRLRVEMVIEAESLLFRNVVGFGEESPLILPKKVRVVGGDAFFAWERCPRGRPSESAKVAAVAASSAEGCVVGGADGITEDVLEITSHEAVDVGGAAVDTIDMEELIAASGEVVDDGVFEDAIESDSVALGCEVEEEEEALPGEVPPVDDPNGLAAESCAGPVEEPPHDGPEADVIAAVESVHAALAADVAHEHELVEEGVYLSKLGYVYVTRPGFEEYGLSKAIGYTNYSADGTNIFAGCHLHHKCDIRRGILTQAVTRQDMARWLATGRPCKGAAKEVRERAGAEHRKTWRDVMAPKALPKSAPP